METYLAAYRRGDFDTSTETLVWGATGVVMLTIAIILASKAIAWFRGRKHPQQEDAVRR